ncbi:hypothetical protein VTH06DRAFT_1452 [Thermothelomyces fergusii]
MECTNAEGKTEGFFGVDHLGQVAQFLGLPRPGGGDKGGSGDAAGSSSSSAGWRAKTVIQ